MTQISLALVEPEQDTQHGPAPSPPKMLVPPMTIAAMAVNMMFELESAWPVETRELTIIPPSAA